MTFEEIKTLIKKAKKIRTYVRLAEGGDGVYLKISKVDLLKGIILMENLNPGKTEYKGTLDDNGIFWTIDY